MTFITWMNSSWIICRFEFLDFADTFWVKFIPWIKWHPVSRGCTDYVYIDFQSRLISLFSNLTENTDTSWNGNLEGSLTGIKRLLSGSEKFSALSMLTECKLAQNLQIVFGYFGEYMSARYWCVRIPVSCGSGWDQVSLPSKPVVLFFAQSGFSGYFCGFAVCTPGGMGNVSLGSCVFTHPEDHRGDPIAPLTQGPALACGNFQSGRAWREATMAALAFSSLAPLWLGSHGVGWWWWGGGALIGRALRCFQKHSVLAASLSVMKKKGLLLMKASSVSRIGRQPEKHYVTEMP